LSRISGLDVGTGSEFCNRVAASRAKEVIAVRYRPIAVQVAHANIERNAEDEVWTFSGSVDAVKSESVRLILGNLTADLIMDPL